MTAEIAIPPDAPFPPAQRAWLSGFFTALLTEADAMSSPAPAATAVAANESAEEYQWHDPSIPLSQRLELAKDRSPELKLMAAMAQLDCGTCGYDCRRYSQAIAAGREKDLTRCSPGGRATAQAIKELVREFPPSAEGITAAAAADKLRPGCDRDHPYAARFISARRLTAAGSAKDVRHVILDLKGSGITYAPGDSLGVKVDNDPELVQSIVDNLGADGSEDVQALDGGRASFREALLRDYSIRLPSVDLVELLSRCAADDGERNRLSAMAADESGKSMEGYEVVDLLVHFPSARPSPADFVAALSPLQPRLYSICSSQSLYPDQVHLTVGVVSYSNQFGRSCRGVASGCLGERMRPGQRVRIYVQKSGHFRLPHNDVPVIMIGPGTGVAPFRSFLQERRCRGAKGMNWLFFGDQHEATDFLYRDELEQMSRDGLLTRLDTAFSRDQDQKVYVQHRILDRGTQLWDWITSGACIYVCGDASRMAVDVHKALTQVVAGHGGMSSQHAAEFLQNLSKRLRYQKDVY
ncbi:MAG: sulfite reductase subunit alpha [Tepidisphaerales bacterium]